MDSEGSISTKMVNFEPEDTKVDTLQDSQEPKAEQQQVADEDDSWVAFQDCTIAFAIDTSGSTLGNTLNIEREAISSIWSLLTPLARSRSRVIPWNSTTEPVISITMLPNLRSYGGTYPTSLVQKSESRNTIKSSTLWVLLTDGIIDASEYQQFAKDLALHGLHGIACIIMVLGNTRRSPWDCDISVGVSVFAAVPDRLFLYVDDTSEIAYLMQCSGRFTKILEVQGKKQPVLDTRTLWFDLPQIDLKDLVYVSIPVPRKLGKIELALQGGLVINLEDLWSGQDLGEETTDRIFQHGDNLRSIMLTSQTRGHVESFQNWLKPFLEPGNLQFSAKLEDGGEAIRTIKAMLEEMQTVVIPEQLRVELQVRLRTAHEQNKVNLLKQYEGKRKKSSHRRKSGNSANERSHEPVHQGRFLSSRTIGGLTPDSDEDSDTWKTDKLVRKDRITPSSSTAGVQEVRSSNVVPLFTNDFFKGTEPGRSFDGRCNLCASLDSTLVLFLRDQPSKLSTPGFPAVSSVSKLAYPLAMGTFPETDILSNYACCDSCSFLLAQSGHTPTGDAILCVLPLVSYKINSPAYLKQLRLAFKMRFGDFDTLMVFLAVLLTAKERVAPVAEKEIWHRGNLLTLDANSTSMSIENVFLNSVRSVYQGNAWEAFFRYPLEGFVTLMLALDCMQSQPDLPHGTENVVWQRFLFALTEQYHEYRGVNGPVLTHVAMTQLIMEVDPRDVKQPRPRVGSSMRSFRDLARNMLGDRRPDSRLFLDLDTLKLSPLLKASDIKIWKRLKDKFEWIDTAAGYAVGAFVHHLARGGTTQTSAQAYFAQLMSQKALQIVFLKPSKIDAEAAEGLVGDLPLMDKEGSTQNE
ncbi:hypothetical protein EPUS_00938 [Endocarpon pusillum Z07020]|uniref:VWFA domain-containing protein n=1 Tax=Endocarpon pusillum (strain Z07020 / HMAS-L-300199) TaxID=1263415 RepID=U1HT11_ENDPU|nr:uncharacterized protein EPUS_00938 [Endocarpon pusillum Z07020]ERF73685.1 hypothetical protein EPUS_00938 [Endocarpon pusillum Z07020]